MLPVGGKPILEHTIAALHNNNIPRITLILGHGASEIKNYFGEKIQSLFNPHYRDSGILVSIAAAAKDFSNKEFLLLMGDNLQDIRIISRVLQQQGDIVVAVEKKECDEEDSKVMIDQGTIAKMGKDIPLDAATAEFAMLIKFSAKGSLVFFNTIEKFIQEGKANAYLMDALNSIIAQGTPLIPVFTNPFPRIEIDTPKDLERAKELINKME